MAITASAQMQQSIAGTWKGTSLCQVKNSPCHDEVVVYHITKAAKENEYQILMNKVVNGTEEEMGTFPAIVDAARKKLTGIMKGKPAWFFTIKDHSMDGALLLENGTLYRIIHVDKVKE